MRSRIDRPGTSGSGDGLPDVLGIERPSRVPADVAVALHDRAVLLHGRGNRDRAYRACRRALRLMETAVGPDGPDVAAILSSLAAIAQDRGEYAEAETLLGRSARILDAVATDAPDVVRLR